MRFRYKGLRRPLMNNFRELYAHVHLSYISQPITPLVFGHGINLPTNRFPRVWSWDNLASYWPAQLLS